MSQFSQTAASIFQTSDFILALMQLVVVVIGLSVLFKTIKNVSVGNTEDVAVASGLVFSVMLMLVGFFGVSALRSVVSNMDPPSQTTVATQAATPTFRSKTSTVHFANEHEVSDALGPEIKRLLNLCEQEPTPTVKADFISAMQQFGALTYGSDAHPVTMHPLVSTMAQLCARQLGDVRTPSPKATP